MNLKEPDYVVIMMTTYGKLENLEGSDTQPRYKGSGGRWRPNGLIITRSLETNSVTKTKLTTKKLFSLSYFCG